MNGARKEAERNDGAGKIDCFSRWEAEQNGKRGKKSRRTNRSDGGRKCGAVDDSKATNVK